MSNQHSAPSFPERTDDECAPLLLDELERAEGPGDVNEVVWQTLICAYLNHDGWRDVAEAVFVKHGYTVDEIVSGNGGFG